MDQKKTGTQPDRTDLGPDHSPLKGSTLTHELWAPCD